MHHQMPIFMSNIETDTFCSLTGIYRHIRHTIEHKTESIHVSSDSRQTK